MVHRLSGKCGAFRWAALMLSGLATATFLSAQAPQIASVTPANEATDVPDATPLVIVFDQAMDTLFPVLTGVGNLALQPAGIAAQVQGTWGDDRRTLTIAPFFGPWPINQTIAWTLNPSGVNALFAIKSAASVPLASVSGSFSTGVGAPAMGSVTPANNAQAVPTNSALTFRFTQPMKKITLPGGNPPAVSITGPGLDPAMLTYSWSSDGRSLVCEYLGGFPRSTRVTWALNPAGAPIELESETGKPLASATYAGAFTTASTGNCNRDPLPGWGSYGMTRRGNYLQESAADPVPDIEFDEPFFFGAVIDSPDFGPPVTAASLEFPDGSTTNLTAFGSFAYFASFETEAEMLQEYPAGTYTERFTQTGLPERVVPIQAHIDFPPIPKIANFAEAQAVNPQQAFTLQWVAFTGASGNDFISMYIYDEEDVSRPVVFQAPDPCVPLELEPTDTSIVLPPNTFQTGRSYVGELLFGKSFLYSTNTFPMMYGYGFNFRAVRFPMKAEGGVLPADPAVLSNGRVQDTDRFAFDLEGTPATAYKIQRVDRLDAVTWPEIGTVTTDATGAAAFEDGQILGAGPWFYRAVAP